MINNKPVGPAIKYFFSRLEKRAAEIQQELDSEASAQEEVLFEEVEGFFRQIMTQNIFFFFLSLKGKHESTILAKAIFSMNRVVRVYYSTSFDEDQSGFIRIRPETKQQTIIVERLHGFRPQAEVMYSSKDQAHVIRFMIRWLMRRIDWDKTRLANLDLYKRVLEQRQAEIEEQIAIAAAQQEEEELQRTLERHHKGIQNRRKIHQ